MNDYLWDRAGEPDEDVRQLESLLLPLRSRRAAPEMPPMRAVPPPLRRWPLFAAAAAVVCALWVTWSFPVASREGWEVAWLTGTSWTDARVVREARVRVGQHIDTGSGLVRIFVGEIGEVQLEPGTLVELVDAGRRDHRVALVRGRMHAAIWAPPGQFFVETPSAVAVDLGCRYSLEVNESGEGSLRVEAGWVGIERSGRVSLVPAGAIAAMRTRAGPGTPRYEDVSAAFGRALDVLDVEPDATARHDALETVLHEARARDALSLWHLLARTGPAERGRVYDRLAELVPPPAGVSRDGILQHDQAMLDAWWGELGLGSADFWRTWTKAWPKDTE